MLSSLVLLSAVAISGCTEASPGVYHYSVHVSGLENFTSDGPADVYVPVPVLNDSPFLGYDDYQYPGMTYWNRSLVTTEKGAMLSFRSSNGTVQNIDMATSRVFMVNSTVQNRRLVISDMMMRPLYPVGNDTSTNYTIRTSRDNVSEEYTTYIFIDKNLRPVRENCSIRITIQLMMYEGSGQGVYGGTPAVHIEESIPANVTGWVPVRVQYGPLQQGG